MESVVLYHYRQPHEYRHFGLSVEINKIKPFLESMVAFFAWHLILVFFIRSPLQTHKKNNGTANEPFFFYTRIYARDQALTPAWYTFLDEQFG